MEINCQIYAPAAIPLGKETTVPVEWKAIGNQNQTGGCREEKYHLLLSGIEALLTTEVHFITWSVLRQRCLSFSYRKW